MNQWYPVHWSGLRIGVLAISRCGSCPQHHLRQPDSHQIWKEQDWFRPDFYLRNITHITIRNGPLCAAFNVLLCIPVPWHLGTHFLLSQKWIKFSPLPRFEPLSPLASRRANHWAVTIWYIDRVQYAGLNDSFR